VRVDESTAVIDRRDFSKLGGGGVENSREGGAKAKPVSDVDVQHLECGPRGREQLLDSRVTPLVVDGLGIRRLLSSYARRAAR
jgi:hypothetical protein